LFRFLRFAGGFATEFSLKLRPTIFVFAPENATPISRKLACRNQKQREFSITRLATAMAVQDSLDLAYQLNERCLKLLRDVTGTPDGGNWPLIAHDPTLWSTLDAQTIERAARFPFVILDVHFTGVEWWREVIDGSAVPAAPHTWPANVSEQLMSETLVFAWHTAKWDRRVARLSLWSVACRSGVDRGATPQQLATI